jgi:hypothetical protein
LFSDEQAITGAINAGFPKEIAENFAEMGTSLRFGKMQEDYIKNPPSKMGRTKLVDFAKVLAAVYTEQKELVSH